MVLLWSIPLAVLLGAGLILVWRPLRSWGREVQFERARELFALQRERLEVEFLRAAAAGGKPRGLRWVDCEWSGGVEFARERKTSHLAALVPVTIRFEAIAGGDMEGVEAVGNLRNASAVLFFQNGHWLTVGKAIFNMNPLEAIEHFKKHYERMSSEPRPASSEPRP